MELEEEQVPTSMVKGCFLYNPGALSQPQPKRKKQNMSSSKNHFMRLPLESDKDADNRHKAFVSCWSVLKEKIEVVITRQHDKVFSSLLGFITTSASQLDKLHLASISTEMFRPPRLEIPTAVLVAGVNMPDHDVQFEQLRVMIRNVVSPHVVLLKSTSCSTGMKATMKDIYLQLSNGDQRAGLMSDAEESHTPHYQRPLTRLPLCSMDVLCGWYRTSCDTMRDHMTPQKKCPDTDLRPPVVMRPPVVIIVEDFEAFSPAVLQDLVASISPHLPQFPVVLVLGVATSVRAVHSSLSRAASSLLCLEVFHTQHSALTLQQIIQETLMDVLPFKLGPNALQFLLHQFFYCNFSLVNFTSGLKFAVMEHFYWQPLSVLLSNRLEGDKQSITLSRALCEAVRATPSFQKYVECQSPEQQVLLLEDDTELESAVCVFLDKLHSYHVTFFPVLECLHILTKHLPSNHLGSKNYELYLNSLEQNITDHPKFQDAWNLVKLTGKEELTDHLRECVSHLKSHLDKQGIGEYLDLFSSCLEQLSSFEEDQPMDTGESTTPLPAAETTSERKMRFQERLRHLQSRKREPSAFDLLKDTVLESILAIFKDMLHFPSSMTLHEVMYFNNVSSMRKQLAPAPRAALQTALSTPHYYLPSAGHVTEASALDQNMPDVCVAYQLHIECGRLINLYDWLQAFVAVVAPSTQATGDSEKKSGSSSKEKKKKGSSSKPEEVDPLLHARFIQAVSELQFLGFIKPTQRKTDHVQRLTWGAC